MMRILLFFMAIGLTTVGCTTSQERNPERPNVLLINVDDLGWKDVGFMGSAYYETPNIDSLANQGMVFSNAYASAANCAPSRACMMSGLHTSRHGIYTVSPSARGNTKTRRLIPIPNHDILADSIYTMAEMFKDNGYRTGTFGKWHLGEDPKTQGFDVNIGGSINGNPRKDGYFSPYKINFITDGPDGEYLTDRLTNEAIQFIKNNRDSSFFLYLPFYTVHTPLMGKEELVQKFKQKEGTDGQHNAKYAAMIYSLDQNLGKLLRTLKDLNLDKNTIVIFTSDNGGVQNISSQEPLRAGKGAYYEGGIRVPLIVKWHDRIEAGTVTDHPVTNMDFYPTLQTLIDADEKSKALDGSDISPVLFGQEMAVANLFWHFPIYLESNGARYNNTRDPLFRTRPGSVIRAGQWKLHEYFEDGGLELYNLAEDLGEKNNLAKSHPEKTKKLHQLLVDWRKAYKAPVPEKLNPEFAPAFEKKMINKKAN